MNIFVGNLNDQASEKQLYDLFAEFGEVRAVKIISDNFTRRSKGYGFVEMNDRTSGERAIEKLHNTRVYMQSIIVNEARPKDQAGYGSSGYNKRY